VRATDRQQIKSGRIKDQKKTERQKPLAQRSVNRGGRDGQKNIKTLFVKGRILRTCARIYIIIQALDFL